METITWKHFKEFCATLSPEELAKPVWILLNDDIEGKSVTGIERIHEDIYRHKDVDEECGTLEDLKEAAGADFKESDYNLTTKKDTPFIWVDEFIDELEINPFASFGRRPHRMDFEDEFEFEQRLEQYDSWELVKKKEKSKLPFDFTDMMVPRMHGEVFYPSKMPVVPPAFEIEGVSVDQLFNKFADKIPLSDFQIKGLKDYMIYYLLAPQYDKTYLNDLLDGKNIKDLSIVQLKGLGMNLGLQIFL